MKKILFIAFLAMLTSLSYASPKIEKQKENTKTTQKKETKKQHFFSWQVVYRCGSGQTITVCCFATQAEAQEYGDSHPASSMCPQQ